MRKGFKSMAMLLCACMMLEMACGSAFAKQPEGNLEAASTLEEAAPEVTAESEASTDAAETELTEEQNAPAEEPESSPAGEAEDSTDTEPESGADADDTTEPAVDTERNEATKPADSAEQEKDTEPALDADQEKEAEPTDDAAKQDDDTEPADDAKLEEAADPETAAAETESKEKTVASADGSIGKTTQNEVAPILGADYYVVLDNSQTKLTFQKTKPDSGKLGENYWGQASGDDVYSSKVDWREKYKDKITSVEFQGGITLSGYNMFSGFTALETVTVSGAVNLSSAFDMFGNCSSLRTVSGLSNFDMSSVKTMMYMFTKCSSLTKLDLGRWDTSNVTDMNGVFNGCSSLKTLTGISYWNTAKADSMENIFEFCSSLTELDLSNWNTEQVTDERNMFSGCTSLRELKVGSYFHMQGNDANADSIHDLQNSGFWVKDGDSQSREWSDAEFVDLFEGGNAAGTYYWVHTLTYNGSDHSGDAPTDDKVYKYEDSATLSGQGGIKPNDQEVFIGWSDGSKKGLVTTKEGATGVLKEGETLKFENANKTVYAVFAEDKNRDKTPDYEETKITVTFDINDGDGSKEKAPHDTTYQVSDRLKRTPLIMSIYATLKWEKEGWIKDGSPATHPAILAGWSDSKEKAKDIILENDMDDGGARLSEKLINRSKAKVPDTDTTYFAVYAADENGDHIVDYLENSVQVEYYANGGTRTDGKWVDNIEGLFYRCSHHHVHNEDGVVLMDLDQGKEYVKRDGATLIGWSEKQVKNPVASDSEVKEASLITTVKMPADGNEKVYAVWAVDNNENGRPDYVEEPPKDESQEKEPPAEKPDDEENTEKPPKEEPPTEKPDHPYWNFHTGISGDSTEQSTVEGWVQDANGWQFYYANGTFAASKWELINGKWYYFKPNGYMLTGWQQIGGHWYHLDEADGDMDTGWYLDLSDGRWYYLDASGAMLTGWQLVSGKYYYLNEVAGAPTYTYNAALRKWIYDGTGRPYGSMYANETTPDGYAVDASGAWIQ